MIQASILVSK